MVKSDQVQKLFLENNGLEGDHLASILDGVSCQQPFSNLTIQENSFNEACIEPISKLLTRRFPANLSDLHLLFCKISTDSTDKLLDALRQKSQLRKLSLVQVSFSETGIKKMTEIVGTCKSLVALDISWNQIKPAQFVPLLEVLSKSRKL